MYLAKLLVRKYFYEVIKFLPLIQNVALGIISRRANARFRIPLNLPISPKLVIRKMESFSGAIR